MRSTPAAGPAQKYIKNSSKMCLANKLLFSSKWEPKGSPRTSKILQNRPKCFPGSIQNESRDSVWKKSPPAPSPRSPNVFQTPSLPCILHFPEVVRRLVLAPILSPFGISFGHLWSPKSAQGAKKRASHKTGKRSIEKDAPVSQK